MVQVNHERSTLRAAAYREAGHAVAAFEHGQRISRLSILQPADRIGSAHLQSLASLDLSAPLSLAARDLLERRILTVLAGPAAERWFRGRTDRGELGIYEEPLAAVVSRLHRSAAVGGAYLQYLRSQVDAWLDRPATQRSINLLATALVARKAITGREARGLWHRALTQSGCRRPEPIPFPA